MISPAAVCPVEPGVEEVRGARLGKFILASTILLATSLDGFARQAWVGLLLADLFVKGFVSFKYAPLALLSRGILAIVKPEGGKSKPINAGPKRFAARIGLGFAAGMLGCELLGSSVGFYGVAAAFGAAALLDATTGLCIACIVYTILWQNRRGRRST